MLTDVDSNIMETIRRGHGSVIDLKMFLLENKTTLIGADPTVAAFLDNVVESFLHLSFLISSDSSSTSTHHLNNDNNNNEDNNMLLGRSSEKGKEVAVIKHQSDDSPDRLSWRKYGQKTIKKLTQPRNYYKCMYAKDGKCNAKKWVQKFEDNVSMSTTEYKGLHTCQAGGFSNHVNDDASSCNNMIQFGSQDQTMTTNSSFFPSLQQIVHQETVVVADTTATKQVYDDQFLGSDEFPFLTCTGVQQETGAVESDTGMDQVWDDQLWASGFSFLPCGGDPIFFDKNF